MSVGVKLPIIALGVVEGPAHVRDLNPLRARRPQGPLINGVAGSHVVGSLGRLWSTRTIPNRPGFCIPRFLVLD